MKRTRKSITVSDSRSRIENMALGAMLTAIVIVLQLLGQFFPGTVASLTLALIPIVVGAIICGPLMGAWLGFVFSFVVLLQPATATFYNFSFIGTVIIVLAKGTLCGFIAGWVYKLLSKINYTVAVIVASAICPVINTGIYALGCFTFFFKDIASQSVENGYSNSIAFVFLVYIGINFVFEFLLNLVLSPVVATLVKLAKRELIKK